MSKTPLTDHYTKRLRNLCDDEFVPIEFARKLERELSAVTEQRDRLAAWIVNNPPKYGGDHACAECYPHSDCLVDGFVCGFHTATALAAVKGGGDE
jgi:hypothetical protein